KLEAVEGVAAGAAVGTVAARTTVACVLDGGRARVGATGVVVLVRAHGEGRACTASGRQQNGGDGGNERLPGCHRRGNVAPTQADLGHHRRRATTSSRGAPMSKGTSSMSP